MRHTIRFAAGLGILVGGCVLAACATTPSPDDLEANSSPTTTSTSTTPTTLPPVTIPTNPPRPAAAGVVVPNVIGMKPSEARLVLRALGFVPVPFNAQCHKATTASESVVSTLSVPGPGQDPRIGATALAPGSARPARSPVGITWSGCFPNGSVVPDVTGLSFDKAVHRLHVAGLAWACFSVPAKHTKATGSTDTTPSDDSSTTTSTTKLPDSSTSSTAAGQAANQPSVVSQGTKSGTVLKAHTVVDFVMRHCPQ